MELLKDYGFELLHYPGKANVVVDALGRKSSGILASLWLFGWSLVDQMWDLVLNVAIYKRRIMVSSLHI